MEKIEYRLKKQTERIGNYSVQLECLEDLNQTIDQVFKLLENSGNPQALEELCPYFGVVWPAGRALAEYLSQVPDLHLEGKNLIELGCGLALPSLLAAQRKATVLATDFHPEVPSFLERNQLLNQVSLSYQKTNWEQNDQDFGIFDWVVGSDILYEQRYSLPLAKTIAHLLAPHGTAVITDPGRPYLQNFVDAMTELGFSSSTLIKKVPHPPLHQEVFVLIFKKIS